MKKKLSSYLLALLMTITTSAPLLSTEVLANDTIINNSVNSVSEETYVASGNITFTGTDSKFKDGTKPCCIGCFNDYIIAVAEDGTEYTLSLTKTDTWEATFIANGLTDGNYTLRISEQYDYYYAYSVTGSFTVKGNDIQNVSLYIIDQPCTASGAVTFIGTEGRFKDGTKPCCIGCFSKYIVVTDSNGNESTVYFTKTDTWEGAWIVGNLEDGNYTISISDEYEFSDYYEIKDGSFTIENQQSLIALSVFIVDSSNEVSIQNTITTSNEVVTTNNSVTNEVIDTNVTVDDSTYTPTVVPSTIAKLLNQLF